MAVILNLETATKNCSVSVARDGELLALREKAGAGYAHAESLHVFIGECLEAAGLSYSDLDAVAVSKGPGSYTGLRIGVSAAKGLCYALGKPLIAVGTLDILAAAVTQNDGLVAPLLDARRMEVYAAVFGCGGTPLKEVSAEIVTEDFLRQYDGKLYVAGDAQEKCRAVMTRPDTVFLADIVYPSAREMARLSHERYEKSDTEDVAYFEPFYLKAFFMPGSKSGQ